MQRVVRPSMVYLLSMVFLLAPPARAYAQTSLVKVAFVGIAFDDVDISIQQGVTNDILALLRAEQSLLTLTPEEISERIGEEKRMLLLSQLQKKDLLDLAARLDVDYVFAGKLSNQSRDPNRTLLVGSFQRFDRATQASFSLDIVRFAGDFGEDLRKIKQEFIVTILPSSSSSLVSAIPVLIVGGITLIGIIALLLTTGKTSGEEPIGAEPVTN